MDSTHIGWWRRHGWTLALLLAAFGFSFAIRTVWSYPIIAQWGPLYTYGGGSDSYYHSRVMSYIILSNHNLIFDPMLRFPVGSVNPREPLFDWMNAILGILFAPFFGGNANVAGAWFLDLQAPLWAALGVFPVYLIGREVSGRRTGLIAALIFPFMSANIDSSTFGYANYLSFYTFVILVVVYSYIRTVKAVGNRRWIQSYRDVHQYLPGLKGFLRTERTAVKWAVFTGVALGALALAWQGYTYAIVVIGIGLLIAMLAERIRKVDSFGLYVSTWIVGLIAFPMAAPYYIVQHAFKTFFDLPLLLFFGVLGLLLPFLLMRDIPWVFSIPFLVGIVGAAALFLKVVLPAYFTNIVTGQGYFVKNLIYSTVAEAQPPSIDGLVVGYGVFTFFLAFVGLAIFAYLIARHRFKRYHVVFMVFAVLSVYLPISATKFFLLGSPAFALLSAEAIHRALDLGGYPELRRTVASLSDRGGQFTAFRKAFKARHVLVLALVTAIILPNVWISVDAGIPSNTKSLLAEQVNHTLPSWLKLNSSAPAGNIFGAAGSSLDTPNEYDSAAYNWLAQQDTNVPQPDRPAFVSWWDYGFQAIDQGQHPSVADNFQNGIDPAGQFLLSQSESQAIGVLATTLLQSEQKASGLPDLPPALNAKLTADGVNVTQLHNLLVNVSYDYNLVVAHPERYLPVDPTTITDDNAMYLAVSFFLADTLPLSGIAKVYDDVQSYTGWSIRYAMSDSRLFPFSGTDTGIFYAPADLTGRVISSAGIPSTFFNVTAVTTTGATYPLGGVPGGVAVASYQINYSAPFYNSMIYRIYIGYNGTDAGISGGGIPGLVGSAGSDPIEPGWMLQHFEVVYRTAYYCPGIKNATSGSGCFLPDNFPTASAIAKRTNGTFDKTAISYFQGGETMLAYYPGETLLGTVVLPDGTPDPGLRATVYDSSNIPHMTAVTARDGSFSLILPPGNDTVNLTTGTLNGLTQAGSTVVKSIHISVPDAVGFSLNPSNLVQRIVLNPSTIDGFVYWNETGGPSYIASEDPVVNGAQVFLGGNNGTAVRSATSDASGVFRFENVPPGVYNLSVQFTGDNFTQQSQLVGANQTVNATVALVPSTISGTVQATVGGAVNDSTVSLSLGGQQIASATTGTTGAFTFKKLLPGNYTLAAVADGGLLRSPLVGVSVDATNKTYSQNLSVGEMAPVEVEVLSGGTTVSGVPVTFTPAVNFAGTSTTALGAVSAATGASVLGVSDASGLATAFLPLGNYSVYALGFVGATLSAGIGTVEASSTGLGSATTLPLTPAETISGPVTSLAASSTSSITDVIAYAGPGRFVVASGTSGAYSLYVPAGTYSLLALQGGTTAPTATEATLVGATVRGPITVPVSLGASVAARFTVGTELPSSTFFPSANASVTVSVGTGGPAVTAASGANGTVAFFLPAQLPTSGSGYCVNATAPGYVATETCGVTPQTLANLVRFPIPLGTVPVSLAVEGLPSGTPVTVTLTAESATAVNRSFAGGPSFAFSLPPGIYGVGARATIANGSIVYLPSTLLNTTVPFGALATHLILILIPELNASGTLTLPAAVKTGNVTVTLSSPTLNVTVNGTTYTSGVRIAAGSYTASVTGHGPLGTYANLTRVTVSPSGAITPALVLNQPGVRVAGTFHKAGNKAIFPVNTTVALVSPSGAVVTLPATLGTFGATVVPDTTYSVYANVTTTAVTPNGSQLRSWTIAPGTKCVVGSTASNCSVEMNGHVNDVWLNGSLVLPGGTPVAGTLRLVGPMPYSNLTTFASANGSFALLLAPGTYDLYAASTTGSPYAALGRVLAVANETGNVSVQLVAGWTDVLTIAAASTAGESVGAANVTLKNPFGFDTRFPSVSVPTTLDLVLPTGSYTVSASAPGRLNGVAGTASATASFRITTGNVATNLALSVPVDPAVAGTLTGPGSVTVRGGGSATFSFAVHDSGNVPVTVSPVGSPSTWTFNFSFSHASLVPGGPAASGEVRITLPPGTAVNHPPVAISFEVANGTSIGAIAPAPRVTVVAYYGVVVGASGALALTLGTAHATVPFFVHNTGNAVETVNLSVVDAGRLAALGWSYAFESSGAASSSIIAGLTPGENNSYLLNLTFSGTAFVPPGSATIEATVLNVTGTFTSTTTLKVPSASITIAPTNGAALQITGPSIGTPPSVLPEWVIVPIAFAPAIALAVGVGLYRWWRTRRWTRR